MRCNKRLELVVCVSGQVTKKARSSEVLGPFQLQKNFITQEQNTKIGFVINVAAVVVVVNPADLAQVQVIT